MNNLKHNKDLLVQENVIDKLEKIIYNYPLSLNNLKNEYLIEQASSYLPYSVGFEIECNSKYTDNKISEVFSKIPDIMDVSGGNYEVRFRIPKGIKGMICLYNICLKLPQYFTLNIGSGIHYHIDFTDFPEAFNHDFIKKHNDYIIKELIKWKTALDTKSVNAKCYLNTRGWVQFQSGFKTMEVRIGEMTFDYTTIIKRMIDCNRIAKEIKGDINYEEKLNKLRNKLKQLNEEEIMEELNYELFRETVKTRTIKI